MVVEEEELVLVEELPLVPWYDVEGLFYTEFPRSFYLSL